MHLEDIVRHETGSLSTESLFSEGGNGLNKKLQCIVINSIKMIHKSCFMQEEKNNLLPREFSGGLTKEATFDLIHKGKVRLWDLGQGIPRRRLYLHDMELPNFGHPEHGGGRTYIKKSTLPALIQTGRCQYAFYGMQILSYQVTLRSIQQIQSCDKI